MAVTVRTSSGNYDIISGHGLLDRLGAVLDVGRKTLVVTDSGVPSEYPDKVVKHCSGEKFVFEQGESFKNFETLGKILKTLVEGGYTRGDRVIAVGGGVAGDTAGFAAAIYMRGIEFINVPTTVLAQVDSSVGGKTAVDFMGFKNVVGAFYPPSKVIIDHDTVRTLPKRQTANGLAEALKMSLTCDAELFKVFEERDPFGNVDLICDRAVLIKRSVVEADEKEKGLRRVLNFGHTLGHAMESANGMKGFLHGECVAAGMVPMCSPEVRERLLPVLEKLGLPYKLEGDTETLLNACLRDKKIESGFVNAVYVGKIGSFEFRKIPLDELRDEIEKARKI